MTYFTSSRVIIIHRIRNEQLILTAKKTSPQICMQISPMQNNSWNTNHKWEQTRLLFQQISISSQEESKKRCIFKADSEDFHIYDSSQKRIATKTRTTFQKKSKKHTTFYVNRHLLCFSIYFKFLSTWLHIKAKLEAVSDAETQTNYTFLYWQTLWNRSTTLRQQTNANVDNNKPPTDVKCRARSWNRGRAWIKRLATVIKAKSEENGWKQNARQKQTTQDSIPLQRNSR